MKNYDARTFYENLKYLCELRNVKIYAVEHMLGVSTGYISRAEKLGCDLHATKALRASDYFGVPVDVLFEIDLCKTDDEYKDYLNLLYWSEG